MIRRLENKDLEQTAKIWLDTNREAHDFIPEAIGRSIISW